MRNSRLTIRVLEPGQPFGDAVRHLTAPLESEHTLNRRGNGVLVLIGDGIVVETHNFFREQDLIEVIHGQALESNGEPIIQAGCPRPFVIEILGPPNDQNADRLREFICYTTYGSAGLCLAVRVDNGFVSRISLLHPIYSTGLPDQ